MVSRLDLGLEIDGLSPLWTVRGALQLVEAQHVNNKQLLSSTLTATYRRLCCLWNTVQKILHLITSRF